ncbi:MAG: sodium ion-translocating decarboxylase subunit beta [Oscillospiraceae bacterium]|nr:sodium ion-translocating decarboxylase subunit beta [Oscillospiraceae bacterium]
MKKEKLLRLGFSALVLLAVWELLGELIAAVLAWYWKADTGSASIGIIGGADGPTMIFVTASRPLLWEILLPAVMAAAGICGLYYLKKKGK